MIRLLVPALLVLATALPAAAATAAELLATVDGALSVADREEPGNPRRAEGIETLLAGPAAGPAAGLPAAERRELRLAAAEAWLGAGQLDKAQAHAAGVLQDQAAGAQRERAGLILVAAWQRAAAAAEDPAAVAPVDDLLRPFGDLGARVRARAASAEAERHLALKRPAEAIPQVDRALAELAKAPPAERVPLYTLRLLAMEAARTAPEAIAAWLAGRAGDPAAAQVSAAALSDGQRLVGQAAPPLKAARIDGQAGVVELAALRGRPVVVAFLASWSRACTPQLPAVARLARAAAGRYALVVVALERKETLRDVPAWIQAHDLGAAPVAGDGLGWDSELDDAFHIEQVPSLVLVGGDGRIAAIDLVGEDAARTVQRVEQALAALAAPPRAAGGGEVVP